MPSKLNAQQVFPVSIKAPSNGEPVNAGGIWANDSQTGFTGVSDAIAYLVAQMFGTACGFSDSALTGALAPPPNVAPASGTQRIATVAAGALSTLAGTNIGNVAYVDQTGLYRWTNVPAVNPDGFWIINGSSGAWYHMLAGVLAPAWTSTLGRGGGTGPGTARIQEVVTLTGPGGLSTLPGGANGATGAGDVCVVPGYGLYIFQTGTAPSDPSGLYVVPSTTGQPGYWVNSLWLFLNAASGVAQLDSAGFTAPVTGGSGIVPQFTPTVPTLNTHFSIPSGYDLGYWKDRDGIVHLQGAVQCPSSLAGGANAAAFNLPGGFRPKATGNEGRTFLCYDPSGGGAPPPCAMVAIVSVTAGGYLAGDVKVTPPAASTGSDVIVFDGVSFLAQA